MNIVNNILGKKKTSRPDIMDKLNRVAKRKWKKPFDKLTDYEKDRCWDIMEGK